VLLLVLVIDSLFPEHEHDYDYEHEWKNKEGGPLARIRPLSTPHLLVV
jgi:hypothetical protein